MEWVYFLILQVLCPTLSALFTVEVESQSYQAQFGGGVAMGCRFNPALGGGSPKLSVIWRRVQPAPILEVYRLENGQENLHSQDLRFRGRAGLVANELKEGVAKLEVTRLRINDSGTYQCLVEMGGVDFKQTVLSVRANYTTVVKSIESDGDEVDLSCQSKGFPRASVTWKDRTDRELPSNTSSVITPEQLFQVTSRLKVKSSDENSYICVFEEDGGQQVAQSARFIIPDEIPEPPRKSKAMIIVPIICLAVVVIVSAGLLYYRRQKGYRRGTLSTKNLLVHPGGGTVTAALCGEREENLKVVLTALYRGSTDEEAKEIAFCEAELPKRLRNIKGQPVSVQDLLPDPGRTVLLEGQHASGKTTLARSLSSSWATGRLRGPFHLQHLQLLFAVDCENATQGDLSQIMMSQLSLGVELSGEELWAVLGGPERVLLVLDGYREGQNGALDESLGRLLAERQACAVLVLAPPGFCPLLKETLTAVGTVLQLVTDTVES